MTRSIDTSRAAAERELTSAGAPFELVDEVVAGQVVKVFKHAPRTLVDVFDHSRTFGSATLAVYEHEQLTFAAQWHAARAFARALAARYGVEKGDRVAISMRNHPEWSVAFWGTQLLGAVTVPLNAWWTPHELAFALRDCDAKVFVGDVERMQRIAPAIDQLGLHGVVVVRAASADRADSYDEIVRAPLTATDIAPPAIGADDLATILYTSGTTGAPKGAIGTHRNHITNMMNTALRAHVARALRGAPPTADGRRPAILQTFPFFHIAGLANLYQSAYSGTTLILMNKWDPAVAADLVEQHSVTNVAGVPTVIAQLLAARHARTKLRRVQVVTMGGTSVPPALLAQVRDELESAPLPIVSYGLTETTSTIITNVGPDYEARPQSIGKPLPTCEIRVVDPDGNNLPPGAVGELCCRGASVMPGYWRADDATTSALRDGWFHTGDAALIDADGFVTIVDRIKDIIIRGGENVYCAEVEAVLHAHEAVQEVAVIGVPHPQLGEEVVAVVRPRAGSQVHPDELRRHAAERLAAFKVPVRIVEWPAELPRTDTGKVLKHVLRQAIAGSGSI
jgi:acyl-CoA synthetase (AMP-forming)/AMP-acid ligase II